MTVRRIVTNLKTADPEKLAAFYRDLFDLEIVMDHGWIITAAASKTGPVQISFASEGGSGTEVPALSIEVDDLDKILQRAGSAGVAIEYGPVDEPWGVRRFFIRDPAGTLLNVLIHAA